MTDDAVNCRTSSTSAETPLKDPDNVLGRMEALPISRWHLKARVIVGSATFFDGIDTVAIGMVLPVLGQTWNMTPSEIGWLISGGFLGQMIGAVGFGFLAERIGRIRVLVLTTAIFAIGGIASAFAVGFVSMFILRFLQGLGLGAEVPVAAPTSTRSRPHRNADASCCFTNLFSWSVSSVPDSLAAPLFRP